MNDKLEGIKPGDRVRVTFEGERVDTRERSGIAIKMDGPLSGEVQFIAAEIDEATFQIERIEPPLKVGDRVRYKGAYGDPKFSFELVAFREGQCVLWGPLESAMSSGRGCDPVYLERIA